MTRQDVLQVSDTGSSLMLVPAAVLVLLMLGSIALDSAVVFLAQRDLSDEAAAVSNDIAGFSAKDASFYEGGAVELSEPAARAYVALAFDDSRRPAAFRSWAGEVEVDGRTVTVSAVAEVPYVFAKALPFLPDSTTVRATSATSAVGG